MDACCSAAFADGGTQKTDKEKEHHLLRRLVMRLAILIVMAVVLYGCVTAGEGRRITPGETAWIEKERTTRAEVVARFGSPRVEFPQSSGFTTALTTTTMTTIDSEGHAKPIATTTQPQRPARLRKATYVYTHSDTAGFPFYEDVGVTQSQFWIVYDEAGVVQDYGFLGYQPDPAIERRQHTIANVSQLPDEAVVFFEEDIW
jgi:hypothetical protein